MLASLRRDVIDKRIVDEVRNKTYIGQARRMRTRYGKIIIQLVIQKDILILNH